MPHGNHVRRLDSLFSILVRLLSLNVRRFGRTDRRLREFYSPVLGAAANGRSLNLPATESVPNLSLHHKFVTRISALSGCLLGVPVWYEYFFTAQPQPATVTASPPSAEGTLALHLAPHQSHGSQLWCEE